MLSATCEQDLEAAFWWRMFIRNGPQGRVTLQVWRMPRPTLPGLLMDCIIMAHLAGVLIKGANC